MRQARTCLLTCLLAYLLTYLLTHLLTYLLTYVLTYLLTYLGVPGSYAWPAGLSKVSIESPYEFTDLLATALAHRIELPLPQSPSSPPPHATPHPPLCAPVALVMDVTATAADGVTNTAQLVLWDVPSVMAPLAIHKRRGETAVEMATRQALTEEVCQTRIQTQ